MAKQLLTANFLKDFENLPKEEQDKVIENLKEKQKATKEKPKTSSLGAEKEKGGADAWS